MPDFLPRADKKLLHWSVTFEHHLSTDARSFGLRDQDAAEYSIAHAEFAHAMALHCSNETNSRSGTVTKNEKRKLLKDLARRLAHIVRACPQVSNTQRVMLGLKETKPRQREVPMPPDAPGVIIRDYRDGTLKLRLFDPNSPTRRCRPEGTKGAMVYVHYGEITKERPINAAQVKHTPRICCQIDLNPKLTKPGEPIYITACWLGTRQQSGPFSRVMPLTIQLARQMIVPVMEAAA
jgi:hypothetical protein